MIYKLLIAVSIFFSACVNVTDKITTPLTRDDIIAKYSDVYGIGTPLIKAIIHSESSGYPHRIRCDRANLEKEQWVIDAIRKYGLDPNNDLTYSSMGLMQILYIVAVIEGLDKDRPMDLLNPETNIKYGSMILGGLYETYENTFDTISAYNWGSIKTYYSNRDKCFKYYNHRYVTETYNEYKRQGGTDD